MLSEVFSPNIRFPLPSGALSLSSSCLLGIQLYCDPRPTHSRAAMILFIPHPRIRDHWGAGPLFQPAAMGVPSLYPKASVRAKHYPLE